MAHLWGWEYVSQPRTPFFQQNEYHCTPIQGIVIMKEKIRNFINKFVQDLFIILLLPVIFVSWLEYGNGPDEL